MNFFCVGIMYSGEYDACDVTLSVYPHRASLKNICLATVGIEPTTFWNTLDACDVTLGTVARHIFFKFARCGFTLGVTSQASRLNLYV